MRVCLALPAAPRRARLFEKIDIQLLAAHQPFKLGDPPVRMGECGALLLHLHRLKLAGARLHDRTHPQLFLRTIKI
jgi:hypothetical protein